VTRTLLDTVNLTKQDTIQSIQGSIPETNQWVLGLRRTIGDEVQLSLIPAPMRVSSGCSRESGDRLLLRVCQACAPARGCAPTTARLRREAALCPC
jgi:hypothetical protein